ncbi:MAG: hypothetical protein RL033_7458 [Pseudomonadota bacterium]
MASVTSSAEPQLNATSPTNYNPKVLRRQRAPAAEYWTWSSSRDEGVVLRRHRRSRRLGGWRSRAFANLAVRLPSPGCPIRPSSLPVNGELRPRPLGALHRLDADRGARSHLLRDDAAASGCVAIDDEIGGDEGPEIAASLVILLAHASLIGVHVGGERNERECGSMQGLQLTSGAMDQVAHRAARHGYAQIAIGLLERC